MKKKYLIMTIITFVVFVCGCSKSNTNIDEYLKSGSNIDSYAKEFMPSIEELPQYKDISYKYNKETALWYKSDAMTLVVEYDDETYKSEKEKLSTKYTYLSEKIPFDDEGLYIIPEYEFSINSYKFKVVKESDKDNTDYPKSFGMIGTSDEKKSIAYLYFYDFDLDYIGNKDEKSSMANFVKKYFKYDF